MSGIDRRVFVASLPGLGLVPALAKSRGAGLSNATEAVWSEFPRQRTEWVREMVGVCHRDIDRARQLLDEHPSLVNATWDWGFGDWETALGAAAHTGRRNIAELLLERGARLDIFAAAMLGQTETVRGMIAAAPGIQRNPGPHGITLLAHARAGGEAAAQTAEYLLSLGDADSRPATEPLADEQKEAYLGHYSGAQPGDVQVEVGKNRNGDLTIAFNGQSAIVLRHAGQDIFFPSGAPSVQIRFASSGDKKVAITVFDQVELLTVNRS